MALSYGEFQCDNADFTVRSITDGGIFSVKRECLTRGSEVFRECHGPSQFFIYKSLLMNDLLPGVHLAGDMFSCCDDGFHMVDTFDDENRTLALNETSVALHALFHLLHKPPKPFVAPPTESKDFTRVWQDVIPDSTIPCPLLPSLFVLADKYVLSREIVDTLKSHLAAYASVFPLQVYGCASSLGCDEIAAEASTHLLYPPLGTYSVDEIRVIPTTEAYHQLVLLHDFRIKKLKEVLSNEDVFPHGYGECNRHSDRTKSIWVAKKRDIIGQIEAGECSVAYRLSRSSTSVAATDVAALMVPIQDELPDCQTCNRAWEAAVAMLAVSCDCSLSLSLGVDF